MLDLLDYFFGFLSFNNKYWHMNPSLFKWNKRFVSNITTNHANSQHKCLYPVLRLIENIWQKEKFLFSWDQTGEEKGLYICTKLCKKILTRFTKVRKDALWPRWWPRDQADRQRDKAPVDLELCGTSMWCLNSNALRVQLAVKTLERQWRVPRQITGEDHGRLQSMWHIRIDELGRAFMCGGSRPRPRVLQKTDHETKQRTGLDTGRAGFSLDMGEARPK